MHITFWLKCANLHAETRSKTRAIIIITDILGLKYRGWELRARKRSTSSCSTNINTPQRLTIKKTPHRVKEHHQNSSLHRKYIFTHIKIQHTVNYRLNDTRNEECLFMSFIRKLCVRPLLWFFFLPKNDELMFISKQ